TRALPPFPTRRSSDLDEASDAQPGKILHEMRDGEMAALGEVPFGRYYGSVDSTPLFVMLAGAFYDRTGDRAFIQSLWPNIERTRSEEHTSELQSLAYL